MPLARVGARTESTTRYTYNARRGQLPRTRIGIVRRTRARHAVCAEGLHFSAFHLLSNNELYFSYVSKDGRSVLFLTSQRGHMEIVRLLLKNGADIQICDKVSTVKLFFICSAELLVSSIVEW